jgi:hypothetical protein
VKAFAALLCLSLLVSTWPVAAAAQSQGLRSAGKLAQESPDAWTYRNPKADVTRYKSFIIEPTAISTDPAANWGKTTEADRQKYAEQFTTALRDEITKSYSLTTKKGPDVGSIRLTLLGVTPNSPIAIATRVTPMGFALSSVKSLRGKPGTFSGSAQVAFELTDSRSGELVAAAIRRRSPDALNIVATTSTESTVDAIAKDVAEAIRTALDTANGR